MRLLPLLEKAMVENLRDWKILSLTLVFASFFVLLMYASLEEGDTAYDVAIVNLDPGAVDGDGASVDAGSAIVSALTRATYPDGGRLFRVSRETDLVRARELLADGSLDLVLVLPEDLSVCILDMREGRNATPAVVRTVGDPSDPGYVMAAAYVDELVLNVTAAMSGIEGPVLLQADTIGASASMDEFERYVPALLVLALMMLLFTTGATIIREKDRGTIVRLRMSSVRLHEYVAAVSLTQVVIGMLALGLTLLTAYALGYRPSGSAGALLVLGLLSSLGVISVSILVAGLLRSIFDLMTIGCFPFFIMMFLSGGMFPLPPLPLLSVGGQTVQVNDLLPTTHSISAMERVLNHGAGLGDLVPEIASLVAVTVAFYAVGAWTLKRRYME